MIPKRDGFKSRWDVFRSESHEHYFNTELTPWMVKTLQILKFLVFSISHLLLIFGTAISKLVVILLATNIELKPSVSRFREKCYASEGNVRRSEITVSVISTLWLIQNVPDIMAIIQSFYRIYRYPKERKDTPLMVFIMECCRSAGLAILFFHVFPSLDPIHCLVLSVSLVFLPLYHKIKKLIHTSFSSAWALRIRLKLLIRSCSYSILLLMIFTSVYLWSVMEVPFFKFITLPLGLILSSFGFWDLWINDGHSMSSYRYLHQHTVMTLLAIVVQIWNEKNEFSYPTNSISITNIGIKRYRMDCETSFLTIHSCKEIISGEHIELRKNLCFVNVIPIGVSFSQYNLALWIILLNFLLRFISRLLSAMSMRVMAALHPLFTVVPLLMMTFTVTCFISPFCSVRRYLWEYGLRWQCLAWSVSLNSLPEIWFGVIWLATYLWWAYQHVKAPKFDPDDEMQGLNDDYRFSEGTEYDAGDLRITNDEIEKTVTLYICATMWHETPTEMMQMLKSIIRLDKEHSLILTGRRRPDEIKYRLEDIACILLTKKKVSAHIFFDDVWEDKVECGRSPNAFFKTFFSLLLELTQNEITDEISTAKDRVLVNTAYGGRLVLRLPAGTLLFVHLKDKKLVRHKKRWSQVMYMYYLLGHRIMDSHMSVEDRQLEADNTYILAIDGDSKFEPSSVMKLLRLMNVKNEIGCACGRIHPLGEGVMIWYQKFEYAISHWFQKAAEHVFGCVLCAPGCFSLFRASALMDDNVMHKYTKTACEARHFVQYDQGEDRWLSTLLLKQGYRIEYVAAADAETYAPEGFHEFFNQRRRWTPSSIANTIDLLAAYKRVCQSNDSIPKTYILYQLLVIGFSLLTPSIVFTMIVYAQVATFEVSSDRMMLCNAIPVLIFITICFITSSNFQIMYAKMVSVIYGFVMLAVAVATTNQIILETALSPTPIFVLCMIAIFIIAALLHPQEFHNIFYGLVFFLMIPCTYIFMALYSLINLNVINWGTREAVSSTTAINAGNTKISSLFQRFGLLRIHDFLKSLPLKSSTTTATAEVVEIRKRVADMETELEELKSVVLSSSSSTPVKTVSREYMNRYLWMDAEYLQICSRGRLNPAEDEFWSSMIEQYLKPLELSEEETRRNAVNLISLRNRISTSVLIINGLLVLAVFLIQKHKEILSFQYKPYEGFEWLKLSKKTGKFELTDEPLKVEPLGLVIIACLLSILIVQTCGMVAHRVNTLISALHEVSSMEDFDFGNRNDENESEIIENARRMCDSMLYNNAHGADGYVRINNDARSTWPLLYRLQQERLMNSLQENSLPHASRL
ncbi:unnamed protein product [Thelazia callipaeda]|uniref:chitin synthase n=1 Tax=Thelazia callipaeda TaxID=103827 RepID=A0A0N5CNA7_THECL|nr:unnamed protein product [Thelazia callipaeda]